MQEMCENLGKHFAVINLTHKGKQNEYYRALRVYFQSRVKGEIGTEVEGTQLQERRTDDCSYL